MPSLSDPPPVAARTVRVGIVAGEPSGDALGAELIAALRARCAGVEVEGVGGPALAAAGCRMLAPMDRLTVIGLVEVLGRYLELRRLRRRLAAHFSAAPPDVFIGIDSPDFNLDLEAALRRRGVPTVHYVGPSVWAWRERRVRRIARAADKTLLLFPFEQAVYARHLLRAAWVGHPLADRIALEPDRAAARARLGLDPAGTLIAMLPGSRGAELKYLPGPFLGALAWCRERRPGLRFACNVVDAAARARVEAALQRHGPGDLPLSLTTGRSHDVLEAADAVLLASGTAALEAMLFKRPMVVGYRLHWLSHRLIMAMLKTPYIAIPNLLAGELLVPECLQNECQPARLGSELLRWLDDESAAGRLRERFTALHRELRRGAGARAADEILGMLKA